MATTTDTLQVIEPATEHVLAELPHAGAEEADAAIARAKAAFPAWRDVAPGERAGILRGVTVREVERGGRKGIEVICEDQGPGIANIDLVMRDGYSTSRGMGMGLPGAKRLMDEFDIRSQEGVGTTIICRKWRT